MFSQKHANSFVCVDRVLRNSHFSFCVFSWRKNMLLFSSHIA